MRQISLLRLPAVTKVLHSHYTILPYCSTHYDSSMYVCTMADHLAMHVALCREKQEVPCMSVHRQTI